MLLFWTWDLLKSRVLNHSWLFRNNFSTSFQFIDQSFHLEKILCVFFSKQNVRRQTTVEMKEWLVCKWLRAFVLFDPLAKVPSWCLSYFLNKNYQLQFTSVALTADLADLAWMSPIWATVITATVRSLPLELTKKLWKTVKVSHLFHSTEKCNNLHAIQWIE